MGNIRVNEGKFEEGTAMRCGERHNRDYRVSVPVHECMNRGESLKCERQKQKEGNALRQTGKPKESVQISQHKNWRYG